MRNPIFRHDIPVAPNTDFSHQFGEYGADITGQNNTPLTPPCTLKEAWAATQQWQQETQGKTPRPLPEKLQRFQNLTIPAGMVRLTNNMIFWLLMTPQLLTDPAHPAMQPLHAKASLNILLAEVNQRFQKYLPPEYQARGWKLEIDFSTFFLDLDQQQNPRTAFPIADYLNFRVMDSNGNCVKQTLGGIGSYPLRDFDFYTLQQSLDPRNLGDFGKKNAQLHALVQDTLPDYPTVMIACPENSTLIATGKTHAVLGAEYTPNTFSPNLTDAYFARMGMESAFYAPVGAVAPFRLIHQRNKRVEAQDPVTLAAITATMGVFQEVLFPKIYRSQKPLEATYTVDGTAPHTTPLLGGYGYNLDLRNGVLGLYQAMYTGKYFQANEVAIEQLLQTAFYQDTARALQARGYGR